MMVDGPQSVRRPVSVHDGALIVDHGCAMAREGDVTAVIREDADREKRVVAEMGEDVPPLCIGGQHVESWDGAGVGGGDGTAVG